MLCLHMVLSSGYDPMVTPTTYFPLNTNSVVASPTEIYLVFLRLLKEVSYICDGFQKFSFINTLKAEYVGRGYIEEIFDQKFEIFTKL